MAVAATMLWGGPAEACTLRVGWEPYAVFTFDGGDGQPVGVDIDLMRAIAAEAGCALEFRALPWKRILVELRAGQIDATTSTQYTAERTAFAVYSVPYRVGVLALFTRRGEAAKLDLDAIEGWASTGKRLGVVLGYSYGPHVDAILAQHEVRDLTDVAPDYATGVRMLVTGRTDAFLSEDVDVMVAEAQALGVADDVERHPAQVPPTDYHILFSRSSVPPEVVSIADRVIDRMKRSGELEALIARYRARPPQR